MTTNMTGLPMLTAYSASKFAIRGLTQAAGKFSSQNYVVQLIDNSLAKELAEYKIMVNCYAPGAITTGLGMRSLLIRECPYGY